MTDTLAEICDRKREHIAASKSRINEAQMLAAAKNAAPVRRFRRTLEQTIGQGRFALIAEIKKASPSRGLIRADFDPAALATAYECGGAACLSVLTDEPYFQGSDEYLAQARDAVSLPVLRKDFMLDPYQIVESRALGADCILLIVAALSDAQMTELEAASFELGMDVLVEVHNEAELDRAVQHLKSRLIGVNNRDLKTLNVDLSTSETLAPRLPSRGVRVCESGISSLDDLKRMQKSGFSCFLVGESLMRQPDVTEATRQLLGLSN